MRAAVLLVTAVLAGCALKVPPTHTDVVEQALPKETRIPPAWHADPRGGEVTNGWLKSFDDPMLESIVARHQGAELVIDESVSPGVVAESADGSVIVDNTLAARLARAETRLAMELMREVGNAGG